MAWDCINFIAVNLELIESKRILISPLNWGFGHVSRCLALLQSLSQRNEVIIAVNQEQKNVFLEYYPHLTYVHHEGYPFKFNGDGRFIRDLARSLKKLNQFRKEEALNCTKLVEKYSIDLVISDHRFGFYSPKCTSVFMTHQTNLALPFPYSMSNLIFRKLMKRFDKIWLVDDLMVNLSGKLSYIGRLKKVEHIGFLSRFKHLEKMEKKYSVLLLSGPEIYWEFLIKTYSGRKIDIVIAPKKTKAVDLLTPKAQAFITNDWKKTDRYLSQAKKIYSFCGYSTLMDFYFLKCDFECVPCPGQFEQMYLAKKMLKKLEHFINNK